MKTEHELNDDILNLTMKIRSEYPELVKYLDEMPVTIPDEKNPEITLKNLKAYHHSLLALLEGYKSEKPD
ncbi:MAG: hypothetical protein V4538_06425 [Bacteroidota bacterium]